MTKLPQEDAFGGPLDGQACPQTWGLKSKMPEGDDSAKNVANPAGLSPEQTEKSAGIPGVGLAMRLGTELVVATMIGTGMGYALDHWLHSGPWFTVVFLFFGAAAGVRNAYRLVHSDLAST
ncbi:MAG: putative F0F1-ATPase subunit (ATPase 1) [Magnetococcales bacterium]|nr:putative F0F1-ATPase subunit (ATPase 1) [Magnetococcales bacterium]